MKNRKIRELYGRWKFNADLMTCQECGYSVIATRMHETAHHAAGCKHEGERNPWLQLVEMLQALKVGGGATAALSDDWQTVPREPTDAMDQAGWDVEELRTPDKIYRAMLAAAPVPHNAVGQQEAACGRSAGPEC